MSIDCFSLSPTGDAAVIKKAEPLKAKAEEYEKLADAAADPAEKKRLKDLARTARNLAPKGSDPG
jgi:hypothetical protein